MIDDLKEIERLSAADRDEEVIALCDRRLEKVPDCREARVSRAISLHALKRYDEAIDDWERVALMDPEDAAPHFHRAEVQFRCKRYVEAIAAFDLAECLDDGYFAGMIQYYRALCYVRIGDRDRAEADLAAIPKEEVYDLLRRSLENWMRKPHRT